MFSVHEGWIQACLYHYSVFTIENISHSKLPWPTDLWKIKIISGSIHRKWSLAVPTFYNDSSESPVNPQHPIYNDFTASPCGFLAFGKCFILCIATCHIKCLWKSRGKSQSRCSGNGPLFRTSRPCSFYTVETLTKGSLQYFIVFCIASECVHEIKDLLPVVNQV
jgi:hypothetical protein